MSTEVKRLRRSHTDRMFAGVCGGLAEYFGVDVVLIRLLFVALELLTAGAGGIVAYLILMIVMPEQQTSDKFPQAPQPGPQR